MRGFIVTDHNEGQVVNLPAGEYTYSFRVIPVGSTYTFKIDNLEFTVEDLTPGVMTPRLKCIFELNTTGSKFYLSDTLGDCIYEPQIESGIFDTTPGPHLLDFERMISEVGLEVNEEFISIYAKKADVTAEINLRADAINSVVGSLSNDVNELQGNYSSIEQTVDSITSTVAVHTSQISTFQQTVNQIYLAIEDAGSGEFASIIQRLDDIELKVGAPGQEGSIHVAINAINLMVSDIDEGLSSIELTVNGISSTVSTHTGQISVVQQSVNSISSTVSTHTGQISTIQQTVDSISSTVSTHTGQISTFQQTVDEIYLAVEDAVSGEYSSIIQRLNSIEVKVGAQGQSGSIQAAVDAVTLSVEDIDFGLSEVVVTVGSITATVSDNAGKIAAIDVRVGSITATVSDNAGKIAAIDVRVDSITTTVTDIETGMSAIVQTVNSITSTVYDEHDALLSQISQDGSTIKITASQIELEGLVTANNNFKILTDGSIEAKNGKFTGEINATSGSIGGMRISGDTIVSDNERLVIDGINNTIFLLDDSMNIKTVIRPGDIPTSVSSYFSGSLNENVPYSGIRGSVTGTTTKDSNTLYLSVGAYEVTIPSITLTASTTHTGGVGSSILSLKLVLSNGISSNDILIAEALALSTGGEGYDQVVIPHQTKKMITKSGTWRLRLISTAETLGGGTSTHNGSLTSSSSSFNVAEIVNRSEIGSNGMMIATSINNYNFMVGDTFEVRRGSYGLQITNSGIRKWNNGSQSWVLTTI